MSAKMAVEYDNQVVKTVRGKKPDVPEYNMRLILAYND
jgi:hypothetical protein